jgi:LysR family nitrogen assimilation transcriptional regulator
MDASTLLISHRVLASGTVREVGRALDVPASTVSAAIARLQSKLAVRLVTASGGRLLSTLEGRRLEPHLAEAASLILDISAMGETSGSPERRAARLSVSLLALERFAIVARTGSIRRAASRARMGQPQLTRQMSALEEALGGHLFERSHRGIELTARGHALFGLAEALGSIWHRIDNGASDRFRRDLTTTRLGSVIPVGTESRIARMLAALAAQWPERSPRNPLFIASDIAENLLTGLGAGAYDLVLVDTDTIPAHFESIPVLRSGLVLVGSSDTVARGGHEPARLLVSAPVAAPSLRSGLREKLTRLIETVLTAEERKKVRLVEIDSIPVIANLVRDYGHVTVLPRSALGEGDTAFASIPLQADCDMQLFLAWKSGPGVEPAVRLISRILGEYSMPQGEP